MKTLIKRILKWSGLSLIVIVAVALVGAMIVLSWADFGGEMEGARLERMKASPQHNGEHFANKPPQPPADMMVNIREMRGDQIRQPPGPFPLEKPSLDDKQAPGLRGIWFGHATVLVEIDGYRVMTDPMLSNHAFPLTALAPERFNPPPLTVDQLPHIDAVTISHDHFDHLDMKTIEALAKTGTHFFFGLGIGAHLERWNVPKEQLHEMDWWESERLGELRFHMTPARHYSGRTLDQKNTLWGSWVIEGPTHRAFHSGDSGYSPHFKEIGEKRGPIDIAFIKVGDYGDDKAWEYIHMIPEDSVRAHQDLGAKTFFPIHWGTFQLSYHPWDAPIERTVAAASKAGIHLVTPKLGQVYDVDMPFTSETWWRRLGSGG